MSRTKILLVAACIALSITGGLAFAQGGLFGRPDPELKAAEQSLQDALMHLQRSRGAGSVGHTRAEAFIALAASELDPGAGSLAPPLAPPPQNRAVPPGR